MVGGITRDFQELSDIIGDTLEKINARLEALEEEMHEKAK